MFLAWRPDSVELKDGIEIYHYRQMRDLAVGLIETNFAKRQAAGKSNPHTCPVKHRGTGEIRFLNFSPDFRGAQQQAENCFIGLWRLASEEEENEALSKGKQ